MRIAPLTQMHGDMMEMRLKEASRRGTRLVRRRFPSPYQCIIEIPLK